ncbi:MAG: CidA/LrgA family protein [Erysipelotrichaceae bacterium]
MYKQLVLLLSISLVSEFLSYFMGRFVASSVIALVLMLVLLAFRFIELEQIDDIASFFLANMTILFIPSAVGIMDHFALLQAIWLPVLVTIVLSTIATFFAAGKTVEVVMKWQSRRG